MKKPKKDMYIQLTYRVLQPLPTNFYAYGDAIGSPMPEPKTYNIIRKVIGEDDTKYFFRFKNKIETASKHSARVFCL